VRKPGAASRCTVSPMETRLQPLLEAIAAEVPRFRIVPKDRAWTQRLIHRLLWVLSLGGQRGYLGRYVTTLGATVYVPPDFDEWSEVDRVIVLHHEWVHLRQFRRYTYLGMALLYLLPLLPVGLAWGRAWLEREAYAATVRATLRLRGEAAVPALRQEILRRFTGPDYLWMWPFPRAVSRWLDRTLDAARQSSDHRGDVTDGDAHG